MLKEPTHIQAHLVFADPQAQNAKNQKSLFFCPRSNGIAMKRTKCILNNEINGKFGLF